MQQRINSGSCERLAAAGVAGTEEGDITAEAVVAGTEEGDTTAAAVVAEAETGLRIVRQQQVIAPLALVYPSHHCLRVSCQQNQQPDKPG